MRKKRVVLIRRLIAAGIGLGLLLVLFVLLRALWGAVGGLFSQRAGGMSGTEGYINRALDRPEVEWNLMLVSEAYPLAEGYTPKLATICSRWQVDERIAAEAERMILDCRESGLNPIICSAFRSVEHQEELFAARDAQHPGQEVVAAPGGSEHHTGLALDIVSYAYQLLDEGQELTPENQWLRSHCAEYGFILRYPPDKSDETGIIYEPWHFRYVGAEAAAEIMEKGITLEEYSGVT